MAFQVKPKDLTFVGDIESTFFIGEKKETDKFSVVFKKKSRSELEQLNIEETLKEVIVEVRDVQDTDGNKLSGQAAIDAVLDDTNAFWAVWGVYNKSMGISAEDSAKKFGARR